jgi:peptidoglycan/xylan/chitin deacetylase (PgdA/CDA1 family)
VPIDSTVDTVPLVLMYHSIEAYRSDPFQVTVHPRRFERQMRWLHRRGLRGVAIRELRSAGTPGTVGLTFDDGYADFLTEALPVLRRYGFTATVYVLAGAFGGHNAWDQPGPRKALLSTDQVRVIADAGLEIGSHGLAHRALPDTSDAMLTDEVAGSRAILSALLGGDIDGFCYPYGAVGPREVAAVRAAGYDYACAVGASIVDRRYAIPRVFIGDRDGPLRLSAKVIRHRLRGGAR